MDPMCVEVTVVVDSWEEIRGERRLSLQLVLQIYHIQFVFLQM